MGDSLWQGTLYLGLNLLVDHVALCHRQDTFLIQELGIVLFQFVEESPVTGRYVVLLSGDHEQED